MYTAIAGRFATEETAATFTDAVQEICRPYGYQIIINNPDFEAETTGGVRIFQEKMSINLLLCLNYPSHKKIKVSSDRIFLELGFASEPNYAGRETNFVDLILKAAALPGPESLYWIFAYEWPSERSIRLKL